MVIMRKENLYAKMEKLEVQIYESVQDRAVKSCPDAPKRKTCDTTESVKQLSKISSKVHALCCPSAVPLYLRCLHCNACRGGVKGLVVVFGDSFCRTV